MGWTWSLFSALWLGFVLYFVAVETWALVREHRTGERGYTLSEHVWHIIGLRDKRTKRIRWQRIGALGFWAWLTVHLFTGWV